MKKHKWESHEIEQVIGFYDHGRGVKWISTELGRDPVVIRRILRENGVHIRSIQEQMKHHYKLKREDAPRTTALTAMEVLACCGLGCGLEPKEIAYRLGYKSSQSARDHLQSAARKIRAREEADKGGQL
jgi:hypothetical protein